MNTETEPKAPEAGHVDNSIPEHELYCPTSRDLFAWLDEPKETRSGSWPAILATEVGEFPSYVPNTVKRAFKLAQWTPKTWQMILDSSPDQTPVATDAELTELRQVQSEIDRHWESYQQWSPQAAREHYQTRSAEIAKYFVQGKIPDNVSARGISEVNHEFLTRRKAIDSLIAPLSAKAASLSVSVIKRALKRVRGWMMEREDMERRTAAEFDVVFVPSYVLKCGASVIIQCDPDRALLSQKVHARNMLAGILTL